ncbi:MAG TPA: protein kinase [Bacillota bacterium]|nr:protein kinase [Bacillota bacterium]
MARKVKKSSYNTIQSGTHIRGKWHDHRYIVKKRLGEGAIGSVYLCSMNGRNVALKISEKNTSITIEVNVLKALQKVQGNKLGPSLYDVDDWVAQDGKTYSYYVMEYIQGMGMHSFIRRYGNQWVGPFLLQLLNDLEALHQAGWVFGDLKLDNVLIDIKPPRVRLVDVGGTTQVGRSIKEYTEFYDRGYWELGSRKAEPSYDLFAVVMIFIHVFYPNRFEKRGDSFALLNRKIAAIPSLKPYRACFYKALKGVYQKSADMREDIIYIMANHPSSSRSIQQKLPFWRRTTPLECISIGMITLSAYGVAWLFT